MKSVDKLIEQINNPYKIVKIDFNCSLEEMSKLSTKVTEIIDGERVLEIEITDKSEYLFVKKKTLDKITNVLKNKANITDATDEFWKTVDLNQFLDKLEEDNDPEFTAKYFPGLLMDREKAIDILKQTFHSKYSIDDVLDKINENGIESLNELNKELLKYEN